MPILNPNSDTPNSKNARRNGRNGTGTPQFKGNPLAGGLASHQHGTTITSGNTYAGSTSGHAATSVFPAGPLNATLPQLPATRTESPGRVVPLQDAVRVSPTEKGTVLRKRIVPVVSRVGGPSKHHDTATTPNTNSHAPTERPTRAPSVTTEIVTHTNNASLPVMSFLRGGGTIHTTEAASHSNARWNVVKKGVVA